MSTTDDDPVSEPGDNGSDRVEQARRRGQAALDRAVGQERQAIRLHDAAAAAQERAADTLEQRAAEQAGSGDEQLLNDRAARERERASAARDRAQGARDRLEEEGFSVPPRDDPPRRTG